ncbi:MAG: alpha/beta hydrolase [Longimicrobiales bacterium]|nr:alpha/beta hydrolase [Longimicrobiales bacterium]
MATLSTRSITPDRDDGPDRWLAALHGIYGAGRNWRSVARSLVDERPEWGAVLVDLRQHGDSMGFDPPHTIEAAAGDLDRLEVGPVRAVLGHSFGGKVALVRGRDDGAVEQVWVIDSTPEAGEPEGSAWDMLELLRDLPDRFDDRDDAVELLVERGMARPVALWMTANLERGDDGYTWRIELDDMEALLTDFFETDLWDAVESPREGLEIHFVRATRSRVLSAEAVGRIREAGRRTGRVFLHDVEGGHWLNADNPDALVELIAPRL